MTTLSQTSDVYQCHVCWIENITVDCDITIAILSVECQCDLGCVAKKRLRPSRSPTCLRRLLCVWTPCVLLLFCVHRCYCFGLISLHQNEDIFGIVSSYLYRSEKRMYPRQMHRHTYPKTDTYQGRIAWRSMCIKYPQNANTSLSVWWLIWIELLTNLWI